MKNIKVSNCPASKATVQNRKNLRTLEMYLWLDTRYMFISYISILKISICYCLQRVHWVATYRGSWRRRTSGEDSLDQWKSPLD